MSLRLPQINNLTITGRLTRDPEMRQTSTGKRVCNFDIAVDRHYRAGGETRKETCFLSCVAWEKTAEIVETSLKKGGPVLLEGELFMEEWNDRHGDRRTAIKVRAYKVHPLEWAGNKGASAGADDNGGEDDETLPF